MENIYGLKGLDETTEKSIKEQIKSVLLSKSSVFLHGKPGEGKSQRVREIDPDCTILELSLVPIEDLTGCLVLRDGNTERVKPFWLEKLIKKCNDEPDKQHILFLDEITNAVPTIQNLAYSLVLDRTVANLWKLPENVGIVCAGNEVEDSIVASEISEPLKNRLSHISVETKIEEWLDWARKHKINPIIIDFIRRTGYLRQQKAEGVNDVTVTPRTWERASKLLDMTNDIELLECTLGRIMVDTILHLNGKFRKYLSNIPNNRDDEDEEDTLYSYGTDDIKGFVKRPVEDYINASMSADIPVFLHGKPGEGKSQRAKNIDPDCTTLELDLIPVEDLSGLVVFNGVVVEKRKPEWLEKLEIKCNNEPEKLHVLFLDELTNAYPSIQQLAYSLILDRTVGGTWKLPDNVRIIAARK